MWGQKCCCHHYLGELFSFNVTVDSAWMNALSDERSSTFKDWKKMVRQEVKYLLLNKKYSDLMIDDLLAYVEFKGFFKTSKKKVGVEFQVLLNTPHWDNDLRIENAFEELVYIYRNQSETEKNVLGKGVLGRYTKRDYIVDEPGSTHRARRYVHND